MERPVESPENKASELFGDWRWRLDNLYWIVDENGNQVLFRMNWAQARLFDNMHFLNVVLKARQLGFSTFIQIFILDACLFNSNIAAGTIAQTLNDAKSIFENKVRFPYDHLPDGLRAAVPALESSKLGMSFGNGSSIRIGTSLRGGTFQYLHVSEYGKISARFPEKAREIKTGAFNTIHAGNVIFVESTAEGQEGEFYELSERARAMQRAGAKLTPLDFKFHFFPWWQEPKYRIDPRGVPIEAEYRKYFVKLAQEHGIKLNLAQQAWYVRKAEAMGDDMMREFPSTPDEAFAASVQGAYYGPQMARAELEGRICPLPLNPSLPVHTWWDIGINDTMTMIFAQRDGPWTNIVDYYENSGYGLKHYADVLLERQRDRGFIYGDHIWPHDGNTRILDETGRTRKDVMRGLGYEPRVLERGLIDPGIEAVRNLLPSCRFDNERAARLVKALKNYRREWDQDNAVFVNRPLHNWASHPADAMRTGAMHNPAVRPVKSWAGPELRVRDPMTR